MRLEFCGSVCFLSPFSTFSVLAPLPLLFPLTDSSFSFVCCETFICSLTFQQDQACFVPAFFLSFSSSARSVPSIPVFTAPLPPPRHIPLSTRCVLSLFSVLACRKTVSPILESPRPCVCVPVLVLVCRANAKKKYRTTSYICNSQLGCVYNFKYS